MINHLNESIGNNSTGLNKYLCKLNHFYPSAVREEGSTIGLPGFLWFLASNACYCLNTAQKLEASFDSFCLTHSPT